MNRLAAALLAAALLVSPLRGAGSGGIRGSVRDRDFDSPLSGVRVSILGTGLVSFTAADGTFLFERVPEGSFTLAFDKEGYERELLPSVVVAAGALAEVRAALASEVVEMEELVVSGADVLADSELGLLEIRAAAATVQDSISSEILSKAGVGDVAGAIKLVTGASVSEGKYATVRGLSDRYTGTTLNGVRIPSADPRRRAVQIDLFPTGTIDTVTVTKTFTPDLQGDFTGGGVDIRTRAVPEGRLFSLGTSIEQDSEATNNPSFLTYTGGGTGKWGFQADARGLPPGTAAGVPNAPNANFNASPAQVATAQEIDRLTREFTPVMGTTRGSRGLNHGFSLVAGNRFSPGGKLLGVLAAVTYSHRFDFYENGQNNAGSVSDASQGVGLRVRDDTRGTDELLLGALVGVNFVPREHHELALTLLANEAVEDVARLQVQDTGGSVEQNQSLQYTERTVASAQLRGSHDLTGARIDWIAAANFTRQDEPDVRFFRNSFDLATLTATRALSSTDAKNSRRIFRDIGEDDTQLALDVTLPVHAGRIKYGVFVDRSDRDYDQFSFTYRLQPQIGSPLNPAVRANNAVARYVADSADALWTDVFLDPGRIGLADNRCPGPPAPNCAARNQLLWYIDDTEDDVDYTGEQKLDASYVMAELPLNPRLRWIGGARYERTRLQVVPTNRAEGKVEVIELLPSGDRALVEVDEAEAVTDIDTGRLLPALGTIWELRPQMKLRAAWSRTLARPQFRELAPVATEEFIFGDEYVGNPHLELSTITNWDLRWEWFRKPAELWAASAFYKVIRDPIELISFGAAGRSLIQPVNYARGSVVGAELEGRVDLGPYASWARGLSAGMNFTWIDSEVDVPAGEQDSVDDFGLDEPTRRLQGQPSYLLNVNVTYETERSSAGLFYNRVGETLLTGAARGLENGTPNVFEQAYSTLDLTYSRTLRGNVTVAVKARNLLRPDRRSVYRTPGGDDAVKTERSGSVLVGISLGLTW
ncbi:MAG TPA: TonB-dependent receptor [Candidatus Polarisedimenticolaceae bacterium]|nr:TonB-dependent receptor [Candidatus Polarisedimenticolaceae bacterium]